jgi:glycosyltransferase involved in cell wall biosynthesis
MATRAEVSVLLPARNAAKTIAEALQSLVDQTLEQWECWIIDDGSTDDTGAIAEAWAARDARFRVIRWRDPQGIVAALNLAAARARAPRLARQDADDRSWPQRLERSLALLDTEPRLGGVATLVRIMPSDLLSAGMQAYREWVNAAVTPQQIEREIWIESPLPHPAMVMRRRAFVQLGGYLAGPWPEDYDLWLRMHAAGWRFAKVPQVLYDWRHHPDRLSFHDPRYNAAAFLECKLRHLQPTLRNRTLVIWGAGRDGRRLANALQAKGYRVHAFIDIDPRKIGRCRLGIPVYAPQALEPGGALARRTVPHMLLLVAVGQRGARKLIRQRLAEFDRRELVDFLCLH